MPVLWEEPPAAPTTTAELRELRAVLRTNPGRWARAATQFNTRATAYGHALKFRREGFSARSAELDNGAWALWACWHGTHAEDA